MLKTQNRTISIFGWVHSNHRQPAIRDESPTAFFMWLDHEWAVFVDMIPCCTVMFIDLTSEEIERITEIEQMFLQSGGML